LAMKPNSTPNLPPSQPQVSQPQGPSQPQSTGQRARARDAAAEGLKIDPKDAVLRRIVSELLRDAQAANDRAKQEAGTAGRGFAAVAEFAQGVQKDAEAAKLLGTGQDEAAIRSYWAAADDFTKATGRYKQLAADAAEQARQKQLADEQARAKQLADEQARAKQMADEQARLKIAEEEERRKAAADAATRIQKPPPVPAAPNEEQRILQVLTEYKAAYERMDAAAVSRLHPALSQSQLANVFGQYRSYAMTIANLKISITGNTAVVSSMISTNIRPRVGDTQSFTRPTTLRLQKTGESWIIVDRR
jgi:hypothetical protein